MPLTPAWSHSLIRRHMLVADRVPDTYAYQTGRRLTNQHAAILLPAEPQDTSRLPSMATGQRFQALESAEGGAPPHPLGDRTTHENAVTTLELRLAGTRKSECLNNY